jgi:small-conductance mechanosensitive channel
LLAVATIAVASATGITWWQRTHLPSRINTLEPVPAATSILIPDEDSATPLQTAPSATAPQASAPGVPDAKEDAAALLRASLEQLTSRVSALEDSGRAQAEQIAALRSSLEQAAARQAERPPHAVQANAAPARSPRRSPGAAPSQKQPPTASVLAVDLWGGQPSVVVAKDGADGAELRFISQGETQGRVTLKRADVANQRATFATSAGEFTMGVGDR